MKRYLNIENSEIILDVYEEWPSFHDAEIISVKLDRGAGEGRYGPTVTVAVHCFLMTNEIVDKYYKTIKHNIITFAFYDVVDFELEHGFGSQNPLSELCISDVRSEQLENINYRVSFDAHFNCDLYFKCSKITVLSLDAGIPNGSVYSLKQDKDIF